MKGLLFILFALTFLSAHSQNLVVNPGFENGLTNWLTYTNGAAFITMQVDSTVAHSGNSSLRITVNHDTVAQTGVVYQDFALQRGGHYLFDCFIKTDSVANGGASNYTIIYLNGARLYGEGSLSVSRTTPGWQEVNYRFYMPQNSDTLQLLIALGATNGTAWFDDVSLTQLTDTSYNQFSMAINSPIGSTINPFTSTNVGPVDPQVSGLNLTPQFEQIGMEYIRTHDYQDACDMHIIFPDTSQSADDSTAYDFILTDSVIKAAVSAGCKIYYRVGESGTTDKALYNPPANFNKWAQVVAHICKHFNQGWDNGFHFNIKYWEIYNEPDLGWNGTINQYIELYRLTGEALKAVDTSLMIGGPAISSLTSTDFLTTFLDSVSTEKLPFSFFSYHYYHTFNPYDFVHYDNQAIQILAQHGLSNIPRIVSEWSNYYYNQANNYYTWRNDPFIAASSLAALTYYQNTNVFKLLRYRTDGTDLGMFDAYGNFTYTGLAYYYMSNFRNAPNRLQTTGGDTLGTSLLAGQSSDGTLSAAIIADNCSSANGYNLNVTDINNSDQYNYYIYRIDSNIISHAVDSGLITASQHTLIVPAKAPYSDFILLQKTTGINSVSTSGNLSVFPNPFSNKITIQYKSIENITGIYVTDILGQTVKTFSAAECQSSKQIQWDGCDDAHQKLSAGLYLIRLQSDKAVYAAPVVHTQ